MGQQEVYNVLKKEEWLSIKELKEVIGDVIIVFRSSSIVILKDHGERIINPSGEKELQTPEITSPRI